MADPAPAPASYEAYQARKYLPELDGLRALSVLGVITVHMHDDVWGWLGGWLGVTVFFVLSGYLITTLALREERQRGSLSFGAFYIRRSFRIFPLYYVTLAIYCVLILGIGLNPEKRPQLLGALPWYLLYLQEVPYSFGIDGVKANLPFYQSWSLGIEEKFYLVWPVLVFVLWRGLRSVRLFGTLALVLAFAAVPLVIDNQGLAACLFWYYQILIGCALALALEDPGRFEKLRFLGGGPWPWVTLAVLLAIHFSFPLLPPKSSAGYGVLFLYTVAVTPFLVGLLLNAGPIQRALSWGPLVFIGRLSYGIYLLHILCLNVAQKVFPPHTGKFAVSLGAYLLACALSVAAAYVFHLIVEKPLIEVGRRWSKRVMSKEKTEAVGAGV